MTTSLHPAIASALLDQKPTGDRAPAQPEPAPVLDPEPSPPIRTAAADARAKDDSGSSETRKRQHREESLDEAVEDSFPASDPPADTQPVGRGPAGDPATKP